MCGAVGIRAEKSGTVQPDKLSRVRVPWLLGRQVRDRGIDRRRTNTQVPRQTPRRCRERFRSPAAPSVTETVQTRSPSSRARPLDWWETFTLQGRTRRCVHRRPRPNWPSPRHRPRPTTDRSPAGTAIRPGPDASTRPRKPPGIPATRRPRAHSNAPQTRLTSGSYLGIVSQPKQSSSFSYILTSHDGLTGPPVGCEAPFHTGFGGPPFKTNPNSNRPWFRGPLVAPRTGGVSTRRADPPSPVTAGPIAARN